MVGTEHSRVPAELDTTVEAAVVKVTSHPFPVVNVKSVESKVNLSSIEFSFIDAAF